MKDFSSLFNKRKRNLIEKVDTMKKQVKTENHSKDFDDDSTLSSEMILREDEPVALNARLAQEIIKNGIQCKAIKEIGSLPVEREPYYSYLFTSTPRLITNRGCITLDINNKGNIDLVQVIQRN
jgi:hypothetical protein